ncbi:MAG TPA: YiiD C-terminal domain-containing protein [Steroidobacteraceae bacterium]|nr:YiiD C-terminal domain-containing protein [Steroidobacteraceae bacterium]
MSNSNPLDRDRLQALLLGCIEPARALGLAVETAGPDAVVLTAPLAGNRNDKATAFAGSLLSAAALAGWALVSCVCAAESFAAEVALQAAEARFLAPARLDFRAEARAPGAAVLDKLKKMLARGGRGRIEIGVAVTAGETQVMNFTGTYAVILGERWRASPDSG